MDFPLRGFVLCDDCAPLTACWSKSKTGKRHPHYLCATKGCVSHRKSIRWDQLEGDFEAVLRDLQTSKGSFQTAKTMFADAWEQRLAHAKDAGVAFKRQVEAVETKIGDLLEGILNASYPTVIAVYQSKIDELERQKLRIEEQMQQTDRLRHTFEESFELAMTLLSSPYKALKNNILSGLEVRGTVLRLASLKPISYSRKDVA
ncbi:MAG: zinc ribbon domain-containing protein [Pseudomonadota bacterium]